MKVRVTGLGSWPGDDLAPVVRMTLGELPDLPYLPELPTRGIGSQMIGRTGAILADLGLDLQPTGWRLTDAPGIDHRRARARFREDFDILEEQAQGYAGPLKLAFAGPWTMAAMVERSRGDRVLADHGARRDLAQALGAGIAETLAEVRRRLPEVEPVLQLDEPLLPQVRAGKIRTASGFSRFRSIDLPEMSGALSGILAAADSAYPGVRSALHCCAPGIDPGLVFGAGFSALSVPAEHLTGALLDRIGPAVESGRELWLGIARTDVSDGAVRPDHLAADALRLLQPLELGEAWADRLVLTPACGLAGWSPGSALQPIRSLREAAEIVVEQLLH